MASRRSRRTSRQPGANATAHRYSRAPADPILDSQYEPRWHRDTFLVDDPLDATWGENWRIEYPRFPDPRPLSRHEFANVLLDIEDRRQWHAERYRPAKASRRASSRLIASEATSTPTWGLSARLRGFGGLRIPVGVRFERPRHISICARRFIRKQVMHALNIAGRRGVGRNKPRHRNAYSAVGC